MLRFETDDPSVLHNGCFLTSFLADGSGEQTYLLQVGVEEGGAFAKTAEVSFQVDRSHFKHFDLHFEGAPA